jgi:hypothetical protein
MNGVVNLVRDRFSPATVAFMIATVTKRCPSNFRESLGNS